MDDEIKLCNGLKMCSCNKFRGETEQLITKLSSIYNSMKRVQHIFNRLSHNVDEQSLVLLSKNKRVMR